MGSAIVIQPLLALNDADFRRIVQGYSSSERYRVQRQTSETQTTISLHLEQIGVPYDKKFDSDPEEINRYRDCLAHGFSFGAYLDQSLIGLTVAEPRWWHKSLWIWEFHVESAFQRQGIGRQMLAAVAGQASQTGLRVLVCETQNTNVPGIRAYRRLGFEIEGIDLSYYTNHDLSQGEVAIFMKHYIEKAT
jgi:GNAT superfamily N-acetyltransferase